MNLGTILLQADGAPAQGGSPWQFYGMIALMIIVFYFFIIRPQSKRQKEIKKFQEALRAGDKVVLSGGIHGKVKELNDNSAIIEIANNVNVKVERSSVFADTANSQPQAK